MPYVPTLLEMLQSGVHFGHQANRWHPKMEPYIFTVRSGVHVINLEKTQLMLASAAEFAKQIAVKGGTVLFLGTKRQAQEPVKAAAEKCGMPYITERWLGGFLTNFQELHRLIKKFRDMKKARETGELEKYTKKERAMFDKEIAKLESFLSGVEKMDTMPDALFIVDIRHEKTAREEAITMHVPTIAMCDTNVNPVAVEHVIPANDDAVRSISLIANVIADAIIEGTSAFKKTEAAKPVTDAKKVQPRAEKVSTSV